MVNKPSIEKKICQLHNHLLKTNLEIAMQIGKLLCQQKKIIKHGYWQKWVNEKLPFSLATAKRYISIHKKSKKMTKEEKEEFMQETLSHNYDKLRNKKPNEYYQQSDKFRDVTRACFANQKCTYINPDQGKFENQIINGDCLSVLDQMPPDSVHLIFTSPPYNNKKNYGNGYDDNKAYDDYLEWLGKVVESCNRVLVKGGRLVLNIDNMTNKNSDNPIYRHALDCDIRVKVRQLNLGLLEYQDIIWLKYPSGGAKVQCWGSYLSPSRPNLRNCKEHIIIWSKGDYTLPNEKNIGPDLTEEEFKEWTYNVWQIHPSTMQSNPHPCTFPEELSNRVLKLFSFPGQTILDPFCGSGTTCYTAQNLNRKFIGVDQNPNYCQWARDRIDGKNMNSIYAEFLDKHKDELSKDLPKDLIEKRLKRQFEIAEKKNNNLKAIAS